MVSVDVKRHVYLLKTLISLMVFVHVKHHVYRLLPLLCRSSSVDTAAHVTYMTSSLKLPVLTGECACPL